MISALAAWVVINFLSTVVCVTITGTALTDWFSIDFSKESPGLVVIARKRIIFPAIFGLAAFINLLVAVDAYGHFLPLENAGTIRVWGLVIASAFNLVGVCVYYFEGLYAAFVGRRK